MIKIIFFPKEGSLYCRITIGGKRKEFSVMGIDREIIFKRGQAVGNSRMANSINNQLATTRVELLNIYRDLCSSSKVKIVTAGLVRKMYLKKVKGLLFGTRLVDVIERHNNNLCNYRAKGDPNKREYAKATIDKFGTMLDHVKRYLEKNYSLSFLVEEIDYDFIEGFYDFLRTPVKDRRPCSNNTAVKWASMLGKTIRPYIIRGIIEDPFIEFNHKTKKGKVVFLDKREFNSIVEFTTSIERLEKVKDCFILQCCTGLAYCDFKTLTKDSIVIDIKGNEWIYKDRGKTEVLSKIPVVPLAKAIIKKYDFNIPTPSNQKYNSYLKELADLCGINKNLTTHVARKTFATWMLNAGVPITTVASMLGHTTTKETEELYTIVMNTTIYEDYLKTKLALPEIWQEAI